MPTTPQFLEPYDPSEGWSWSRATDRAGTGADPADPAVGADPSGRARGEASDAATRVDADARPTAGPAGRGVDPDAPVFVISIAAEMSDLHPQTLRAYERDGLIMPARTPGGTRRYSRRDVERLQLIRRLTQDEGLNLAGVRLVLELGEKLEQSRRRNAELEEMLRTLASRLEQRPASGRYDMVTSPSTGLEVHRSSRRTGTRSTVPVQRARPLAPPDVRTDPRPETRSSGS